MTDILGKLPNWALLVAICILAPLAIYSITQHVNTDSQQSIDLQTLSNTVSSLVVVVEYNYKETERNSEASASNAKIIHETQARLERIMGRIEARLDEENN